MSRAWRDSRLPDNHEHLAAGGGTRADARRGGIRRLGRGFLGEKPRSFDEASASSGALRGDADRYRDRLRRAISVLRDHPEARNLPMGAIGYCMGGQAALEVARSGEDLALVASFHGLLDTDRRATAATSV